MRDAKELLEEKGIRVSIQRIKILKFMRDYSGHPSVDEIYTELSKEIPTLSRTTVYNAMKVFEEKGLIRELPLKGEEVCFDYVTKDHAHFLCNKCERVYDLEECYYDGAEKVIEGHLIETRCICYRGICRECREEELDE